MGKFSLAILLCGPVVVGGAIDLPPRPRDANVPVIDGRDFLRGSAAVDAAAFAEELLADGGFSVDAKWIPADFLIRPTDATGLPLIGPSSDGIETGSLMRYQIGWAGTGKVVPFVALDYYVATHIDAFPTLLNPFAGFGALFTGAKKTGFATVAGQILPGVQFEIDQVGLELRGGAIFRFRDPIDENGRFLSTYSDNNYTGRYSQGDYGDYPVPNGEGGFSLGEPYIGASWYGLDLMALLSDDNRLALFQLARPVSMLRPDSRLRYVTPAIAYLAQDYQNNSDGNVWRFTGSLDYRLGRTLLEPAVDLGLVPARVSSAQLQLFSRALLAGLSYFSVEHEQARTGYKIGLGFDSRQNASMVDEYPGTTLRFELTASYNFAEDIAAEPLSTDAWVYRLLIRRSGPGLMGSW